MKQRIRIPGAVVSMTDAERRAELDRRNAEANRLSEQSARAKGTK